MSRRPGWRGSGDQGSTAAQTREAFPLGCRVRFHREAMAAAQIRVYRDVGATVVGYGREPHIVALVRDGNRSREAWSVAFLRREDGLHA